MRVFVEKRRTGMMTTAGRRRMGRKRGRQEKACRVQTEGGSFQARGWVLFRRMRGDLKASRRWASVAEKEKEKIRMHRHTSAHDAPISALTKRAAEQQPQGRKSQCFPSGGSFIKSED